MEVKKKMRAKNSKTTKLVELGIFVALVLVIQLLGGAVKVGPISISLVLIPIAVGGILLGPLCGAVLGLTFGVATVIGGLTGADPFTATLLNSGAWGAVFTTLLCLVKGTMAGFVSALIYKLLAPKSRVAAVLLAAVAAPVVNTGLFVLGALTVLNSLITQNFLGSGSNIIYFVFIGCAGVNFLIELAVNVIFTPAIRRILTAVRRG